MRNAAGGCQQVRRAGQDRSRRVVPEVIGPRAFDHVRQHLHPFVMVGGMRRRAVAIVSATRSNGGQRGSAAVGITVRVVTSFALISP